VGGSVDRSPVVSLGILSEATDGTICPGVDLASKNEYQETPGGKGGLCIRPKPWHGLWNVVKVTLELTVGQSVLVSSPSWDWPDFSQCNECYWPSVFSALSDDSTGLWIVINNHLRGCTYLHTYIFRVGLYSYFSILKTTYNIQYTRPLLLQMLLITP
jgi:hypothetical protein